ncbi:response regulator transcription factor [Flavobacterium sp. xlx-214]|uniref:LytR/AlgR family response regulator transcription factor n=1 Tax=unclassified Flavobacterium TaxID=196869 RepID=UPI0013D6F71C|nr:MULTISPECIES: LytTR family DNA-binding domain-containing protein [unclassified Flavobacterium]MBA5793708.1 response regulator transcription factor [Flavobacterium sp. xlx-221]QMI83270.1 response regulator transcription factor [Flavobacterium sp. xlx-214]
MIKAIALDDEPLALTILEHLCLKNEDITLEKTFTSPQDALHYLEAYPVDLLFLDIQMPDKDGVSFFKSLINKPLVIFTTAFDHYAVEGFNVNAVDYLLKPIAYERFEQAIEKVKNIKQIGNNSLDDAYILIRADYKLNKIYLKDIQFIEGLDDYIQIHIAGKPKIVARMSMKNIVEQLPKNDFLRIHRSFIVPIQKISSIQSKSVFINELEFPIGDTYKNDVLAIFTDKK